MCFLRDLPAQDAMATLEQSLRAPRLIIGVGLDSAEVGNPPRSSARLRAAPAPGSGSLRTPARRARPDYIWQALDVLGVERIDHGVRCLEDRRLVARLEADRIPLTVCPFSNVKLRVVETLDQHPLAQMLEHGLCATVNSDDPAYFGGYVGENLAGVANALKLDDGALAPARPQQLRSRVPGRRRTSPPPGRARRCSLLSEDDVLSALPERHARPARAGARCPRPRSGSGCRRAGRRCSRTGSRRRAAGSRSR